MKKRMERVGLKPPRSRRDVEREIWGTAHGGAMAFRERLEAVLKPMVERMNSGLPSSDEDLDRFVSLMLFFEAASLVCARSQAELAGLGDDAIKQLALCLGLEPNWSAESSCNGSRA